MTCRTSRLSSSASRRLGVSASRRLGVSAAVGGGVLVEVIARRPVEIVHRGPWNATAALVGASANVVSAALSAPTKVWQAVGFAVVVGMRLAALRWGLHTSVPADAGYTFTSRRRQIEKGTPQPPTDDTPDRDSS